MKVAAGFIPLSLSREPADSLDERCTEMAGRLAVEEVGAGAMTGLERGSRCVTALGFVLDLPG